MNDRIAKALNKLFDRHRAGALWKQGLFEGAGLK